MKSKPKRRSLRTESLEARVCMAASLGWDGPGLGSASLSYNIDTVGSGLDEATVRSAIETALQAWSDVADIEFIPTDQTGLRDSLDFSFTEIDGSGGTLAQAYMPDDVNRSRIAGDVEFDSSESWEVGNTLGNRATDLVMVAVHEIGHALGLEHDDTAGSTLNPTISPISSFSSLPASDVDSILALYAPAEDSTAEDSLAEPVGETGDEDVVADDLDIEVDADIDAEEEEEIVPPIEQPDSTPRRSPWARRSPWVRHRIGPGLRHFQTPTDETSSDDTSDDTSDVETGLDRDLNSRLSNSGLSNRFIANRGPWRR